MSATYPPNQAHPARAAKRPVWPWALATLVPLACAGACAFYLLAPVESGPWHQSWAVTVTHAGRTERSSGFGLGRCHEEGPRGASVTKQAAMERACAAAGACPGDAVCDCAARAQVAYRCESAQGPGGNRLGSLINVPVH